MGIEGIENLINKYEKKYAMALENAKAQAEAAGCGVMTIGTDEILVCVYVPAGKVLHAISREGYLKWLAEREAAAEN